MKKFLSLVLAALLLMSCTAFAETYEDKLDVYGSATSKAVTDNGTPGTVRTELWMQVDTTGTGLDDEGNEINTQIDVTVPLVLVFSTNLSGGEATCADNYKFTSNSTMDLVVTKIETETTYDGMTLVEYDTAFATGTPDQYKVQLSVADGVKDGAGFQAGPWDLKTATHETNATEGGELLLPKKDDVTVIADMETTQLSFYTARKADGTQDTEKGVHLLNVTYTVALNLADSFGDENNNGNNDTALGEAITTTSELNGAEVVPAA